MAIKENRKNKTNYKIKENQLNWEWNKNRKLRRQAIKKMRIKWKEWKNESKKCKDKIKLN